MVDAALLVCFAAGLALVAAAAFLVSTPLGLAVAGIELAAVGFAYSRGGSQ